MKTNVDSIVRMKVKGEIIHPELWVERGFATTWDGRPKLTVGIGGIVHNVRVGDPVFGWYADHLNAGVAVSDPDPSKQRGVNVFSCIGNEAKVLTGSAKGAKGVVVGKTYFFAGRSYRLVVDFEPGDREKLSIGDKIEIEAWGTGLSIIDHEDVRILSLSPDLLIKMGVEAFDGKLRVPVVKTLPGSLMGTGVGRGGAHMGAWDIQSCSPELNKEHDLYSLRFGDIVAITDVTCDYGNSVYEDHVIIGVVSHGESELGGHGPGVATIFSGPKEKLVPIHDSKANVAYILGLRDDLEW